MKIGIFTETYTPQINGVVTYINNFSKEAKKQGHEIYIFAPETEKGDSNPEFAEFRFKSFQFPFEKNYRVALPISVKNIFPLKKLELDILYSQNPFGMGGFLGQIVAKAKKVPIVYINHTMYSEYLHYFFGDFNLFKKSVDKMLSAFCNNCDGIIVPSEKIKNHLLTNGVKKSIEIILTGLQLEEFNANKKDSKKFFKKYNINKNEKILLYVGRIAKEKNIPFIINSFKTVRKKFGSVKLIIAGSGNELEKLKKLSISLNLNNDIIFTGFLDKKDVVEAYNSVDIFVFSSLTETQGLVVCEAVASGLPVVAVYDEPFKKIVIDGYNGFLTNNKINDFSEKIVYLLKNESCLNNFSYNSKILSKEKLDIKNQVAKTIKFFNYIITKQRI